MANSVGDTLIYDSNTPGGYTLQGHSTNSTSLEKIMEGRWDFVVLQEQSQRPSLPIEQVVMNVFPYARFLDSVNIAHNPCGETLFYMTWGRKNGDASNCPTWPPVCTYCGMDSLLHLRYMMMADSNDAMVSPVGAVWHYIRDHFPGIELYSQDESHPSTAGSYAAACSFYTAIFKKDPTLINYDFTLNPEDAATIRATTKLMVYDSLPNWNIGIYDLTSNFSYTHISGYTYQFFNQSQNATGQNWDFGTATDTTSTPTFTFAEPGIYNVELTTFNPCDTVTSAKLVVVLATGFYNIDSKKPLFYPNPASDQIFINPPKNSTLSINIYNLQGKEVLTTKCFTGNRIDIKSLKPGLYILKWNGVNNTGFRKLIIEE